MKKAYVLLCIIFIFISCGQKQEKVEIISEDGVDVVLNHIEPYQIRGEKTSFFKWKIDDEAIYVMSEDRGYEFLKFDLNGNLVKKIRKKYHPVPVSDETIKTRKEMYQKSGIKAWFPKHWLPICDFFVDEEGRIYAMTFERGENPKEYIYNISNSEGVYVADAGLEICFYGDRSVCAQINNNRLYYFKLKSDEFHEFKVSRIRWE